MRELTGPLKPREKDNLAWRFFRQIDVADVLVVIVNGGKIDASVSLEIGYATARRVPILYLGEPEEAAYRVRGGVVSEEELLALLSPKARMPHLVNVKKFDSDYQVGPPPGTLGEEKTLSYDSLSQASRRLPLASREILFWAEQSGGSTLHILVAEAGVLATFDLASLVNSNRAEAIASIVGVIMPGTDYHFEWQDGQWVGEA